jgi:hypothetical protein
LWDFFQENNVITIEAEFEQMQALLSEERQRPAHVDFRGDQQDPFKMFLLCKSLNSFRLGYCPSQQLGLK